jgi:hypothetical protein
MSDFAVMVLIRPADLGGVDGVRLTGEYHAELRQRFRRAEVDPYNANDYATHWFGKRLRVEH